MAGELILATAGVSMPFQIIFLSERPRFFCIILLDTQTSTDLKRKGTLKKVKDQKVRELGVIFEIGYNTTRKENDLK